MTSSAHSSGNSATEITIEADSVADALAEASERLACPLSQIRHRVLAEPRNGFLGMGVRKARVKAWLHDAVGRQVEDALRAVRDLDGHFLTELRGRDIVLMVYAPLGEGRPVEVGRVQVAIRDYVPETLDESAIRDAVAVADGQPRVVGRLHREGERDGYFTLHISSDKMAAEITLAPPKRGGREVELGDVRTALVKQGVVHGIDIGELEMAIRDRQYNVPIRVATGRAPEPGDEGRLEWGFRADKHVINFEEDERGRVDYRELDLIESVRAGEVLVHKHPPRMGKPGENVFGHPIAPAQGRPVELPAGDNVYVEGDDLKAAIDGHATRVGSRVLVSPLYRVKGDVDYATGNIDFDGTVCVDGLVEDAFSVCARGSVFVRKSIGKCRIQVDGNLVVIGGILGRQEADIQVGGDLIALFIENSRVRVGANLMVNELILHSDIAVAGNLVMHGARAALVGGSASAGGDISVRAIGGEGTTRTHVRAGVRPDQLQRIRELRAAIDEDDERLGKAEEAIRIVEVRGARPGAAPMDPRVAQLRSSVGQLQSRIRGHKEAIREVETEITENSTGARIHVRETVMAGTRVEIGSAAIVLNAPVQYATFTRVGGEIKIHPYSGDL